jgi:hypothetical protein
MTDNGNGIRELLERQRGLGTTIRDMRRALVDAAVTARHDYIDRRADAVDAARRRGFDIETIAGDTVWGADRPTAHHTGDAIDRRLASIDDRSRAAYALTGIDPLDIGDDGAWPVKETRRVGSLMTGFKLDNRAALPNIERAGAVTLALAETMNVDEIRQRVLEVMSLAFDVAVIGAVTNGHPDDLSRFLRHEKATGGVKPRYVAPYPWAMPTPRDARPSAPVPVPGTPTYDVDRALASVNVASYPSGNACFAACDARALDEAFAALRHRIERGIRDDHARRPPKLAESDRELLVGKSRTARAVADAFMDNHRPELGALAFAGVDIARLIVDRCHDDMFVQFLGAPAQGEWLGYVDGAGRWPTLAMLSGSIAEWSGCTLTYSFTMDINSDWRDADAATLTEEGLEDALLRAEIEAVRELSSEIARNREQPSAIINAIDTLNVGIADLTGAAGADELTKLAEMAASLMPAPRS